MTRPLPEQVDDPSASQTAEEVESYYRQAEPGAPAAFRTTYFHELAFTLTTVDALSPQRVYLRDAPAWGGPSFYVTSGRNYDAPGGKSRLVKPTPAVVAFVEAHPDGSYPFFEVSSQRKRI